MPYLDFVKPFDTGELIKKIEAWFSAYTFELELRKVCMGTLTSFRGKCINKRFRDALKQSCSSNNASAWEKDNYNHEVAFSYNIEARPRPAFDNLHEHRFTFDVCANVHDSNRLEWDKTFEENEKRVTYAKKMFDECCYLLSEEGREEIERIRNKWEKGMDYLKDANNKAKEYSVLTYEFDISRYK